MYQIPLKKLTALEALLPKRKSNYRWGLFYMGQKLLKYIFSTVTVQDVQHISNATKKLHLQQNQISHSLTNKITHLKPLNNETKFNTRTTYNLLS
jgi:hypothetical protein